ncbi:diguanylate cyclase domain-containing protein [Roseateles sp. BYS180W]|uniref:diguanylate cyclase n=1 Tax=Roseateles rivi TaxID=3299028 RepID=A0ABW7FTS9_9BURK
MSVVFSEVLPADWDQDLQRCLTVAHHARQLGQFQMGTTAAARAWVLAQQQESDQHRLAAGQLRLFFALRTGQFQQVLDLAEQVLPLAAELLATRELNEMLRWAALAGAELGAFDTAMNHAHRALQLAQTQGDRVVQALALNSLAVCFHAMGDPWQAERMMRDGAVLMGDEAGPYELLVHSINLTEVLLTQHNITEMLVPPEQTRQLLIRTLHVAREAAQHARTYAAPYALMCAGANLGEVLGLLGEHADARQHLLRAQELARSLGAQHIEGSLYARLARLALEQQQPGQALHHAEHALALMSSESHWSTLFGPQQLHATAYRAAKALGDSACAMHHLERLQQLQRRRNLLALQALSQHTHARVEAESWGLCQSGRTLVRDQAEPMARSDPLTGLSTGALLQQHLPELLLSAEQERRCVTLAVLEIDHFDTLLCHGGQAVGDTLLRDLAQLLRDNVRHSDMQLRSQSQQLQVVLCGVDAKHAAEVFERLREAVLQADWSALALPQRVSLSVGLSCTPPYNAEWLTQHAEAALYRGRQNGGNRVLLG